MTAGEGSSFCWTIAIYQTFGCPALQNLPNPPRIQGIPAGKKVANAGECRGLPFRNPTEQCCSQEQYADAVFAEPVSETLRRQSHVSSQNDQPCASKQGSPYLKSGSIETRTRYLRHPVRGPKRRVVSVSDQPAYASVSDGRSLRNPG